MILCLGEKQLGGRLGVTVAVGVGTAFHCCLTPGHWAASDVDRWWSFREVSSLAEIG